jgi:flagellar biosynthesis protein FliR
MSTSPLKLLILGFIAGALATLVFHQSVWFALNTAGIIPADRPAWPLDPIPPLGIPAVVSKAFWGGLWGAMLALFLARVEGAGYWLGWILVGAVAPSLVAIYVVPMIKGLPAAELWPRAGIAATVNGAWGLGTGVFLRVFGAGRR